MSSLSPNQWQSSPSSSSSRLPEFGVDQDIKPNVEEILTLSSRNSPRPSSTAAAAIQSPHQAHRPSPNELSTVNSLQLHLQHGSPSVTDSPQQRTSRLSDLTTAYGQPAAPAQKLAETATSPNMNTHNPMLAGYLAMLAKPTSPMVIPPSLPSTDYIEMNPDDDAVASVLASPEYMSLGDDFGVGPAGGSEYGDYLTSPYYNASPLDDSPYSTFLDTPLIADESDFGCLSSPAIYDSSMLFPVMDIYDTASNYPAVTPVDVKPVPMPSPSLPPQLDTANMYTMSSDDHPTSATSLYPSPRLPTVPTRRKSSATGTRKNITPASLVPIDAPTQPRKYIMPSATSRKEVPAVFANKKRSRVQAFDEEDELDVEEPALSPNASVKEQIEWKRRQNTLAARKSRKRKLEHQQHLEAQVRDLTRERDIWKTRCETVIGILNSHGHEMTAFEDLL